MAIAASLPASCGRLAVWVQTKRELNKKLASCESTTSGDPDAGFWPAQRLPRALAVNEPGGLVQLDTVHVNVAPDKSLKHFTAYDPIAKWTVAQALNRATAVSAAIFLDKIVVEMPFPVKAIQVDGGSEFMAEFENACEKKGLRLLVLPPKAPQINGAVERCNGA